MKKLKLTMLGVGNGFSKNIYNNNALLETPNEKTLIDCGITAWHSLEELGCEMHEIDKIFITHLHFDHSGGLEPIALYSKFFSNRKVTLVIPKPIKKILWENVLKGTIENWSHSLHALEDFFHVISPDEKEYFNLCGQIKAQWIQTKHIKGKFSCGLLIEDKMFYSSDMICDQDLVTSLYDEGVDLFFHDCQLKGGHVHASFDGLCKYPESIRKAMYLMHHGQAKVDKVCHKMKFLKQHIPMELIFNRQTQLNEL